MKKNKTSFMEMSKDYRLIDILLYVKGLSQAH